ncbi:AAA family ATPase [Bacillus sp. UNCCL81]|uniref:AAA family ATPase n=1 Tax=Bacillus sp. UNCCL81 TaxID=1502755 RepID=UPI0008F2502B|nr:AAA family ATPase [Bacillus sp. UNCCL81]SFC42198.1 AAA domain-containing protein, putative AbiEii toxin, Type IV TA system [Bacillus sp. UNCCL81]
MELIYLWVKSYGGFKESDFHFRNDYQFVYDPMTYYLHIKNGIGERMPNHFFGPNISNLSVIVGDNGAGKTTLLRMILNNLTTLEDSSTPFIVGFYDQEQNNLKVYSHMIQIEKIVCFEKKVTLMKKGSFEDWINQTKFVYVNNVLDIHDYSQAKSSMVHDASVGGLLRNDYTNALQKKKISINENQIYHYFNKEILRQIDFLYHYKLGEFETIPFFEMLNLLTVKTVDNGNNRTILKESLKNVLYRDSLNKHGNSYRNLKEDSLEKLKSSDLMAMWDKNIEKLLSMVQQSIKKFHYISSEYQIFSVESKWSFLVADHLVINAIKYIAEPEGTLDDRYKELKCLFDAYQQYDNQDSIISFSRKFLERVQKKLEKAGIINKYDITPYISFLKWLEDEYELLDVEVDKESGSTIRIKLNDTNKERFRSFFELYNKTCDPFYFLNFSWGLSTGENNLLSLYSRLHSVLKLDTGNMATSDKVLNYSTAEIQCKNVMLLIDEADLSFHPKWQIQYINRLLHILKVMFKSCEVQVILTTHSPMLLSDVPKSNVIYLKGGINDSLNDHSETFGQNVYTLFKDAFFMDQTVGEFSNMIIQDVGYGINNWVQATIYNDLENNQISRLKYYEYITGIIGENVIRKAFETKLQRLRESYQTEKLKSAMSLYSEMSTEDRNRLIDYIIKINSKEQEQ